MRETSFDETWVQFLQDSQDIFFFGLMCGTDPHITNGGRFLEVLQVRSTPDPINADHSAYPVVIARLSITMPRLAPRQTTVIPTD